MRVWSVTLDAEWSEFALEADSLWFGGQVVISHVPDTGEWDVTVLVPHQTRWVNDVDEFYLGAFDTLREALKTFFTREREIAREERKLGAMFDQVEAERIALEELDQEF